METINWAGVAISRRAAASQAHVFASLGPSGKLLLTGQVSKDELHTVFVEQAAALASAGADALVVETTTDLDEASVALAAACLWWSAWCSTAARIGTGRCWIPLLNRRPRS